MKQLQDSLSILESIRDYSDREEVIRVSKQAFETCLFCLEAASIISKTIDNEASREFFLYNAVRDVELKIKEKSIKDEDVFNSLMTGYFELYNLYLEYGRYRKALRFLEKLNTLDLSERYKCKYRMLSLKVYLEDDEEVERLYSSLEESSKSDEDKLRMYLPYSVYLYKRLAYDSVKVMIERIRSINSKMIPLLKGEEDLNEDDEHKQALRVIRSNAYLINSCPYFLTALKELYD